MTEKEYRTLNAVSYSFLKDLKQIGPKAILGVTEKDSTSGMTLGTLVDKMTSNADYDWSEDFIITDEYLDLSGDTAVSQIIKYLNENPDYPTNDDNILLLSEQLGLLSGIKDRDKRAARILGDKFNSQFNILSESKKGKQIISQSDFELGMAMHLTLVTHQFTSRFFQDFGWNYILTQVPIQFKINEVNCKSLLDRVIIDHLNKTIEPIDIKTGEEKSFLSNFNRYEYYLQAAMYCLAVDQFKLQQGLDDYEVLPFKFIYISRNNPNLPLIYEMDEQFVLDHINGFINKYGEIEKGILQLIDDYSWYIANEVYDVKREIFEANGVIKLKNFNKREE